MAECSPNDLLTDAKCFLCLTEKEVDLAIVQLLREWSGDTASTPQELLEDAKCITCLDTKQIETIQTQLLCNIAG